MRRTRCRIVSALLLISALVHPEVGAAARPASHAPEETVIHRAFLPSERNVQGEFVLLRRDGQWVARTLLHTWSLRRAVQRLERRERERWAGGTLPTDAQTFLAALRRARTQALEELSAEQPDETGESATGNPGDSATRWRKQLGLEFVCSPDAREDRVEFFALELDRQDDRLSITGRRALEQIALGADYSCASVVHQAHAAGATLDGDQLRELEALGRAGH